MARVQQQSVGTMTIWMVVFVFFWLVSTVWLVILYTGQEEIVNRANRMEREINRLATRSERDSIELVQAATEGGPTAIGLLEGARAETARLATGEPADQADVVRSKRNDLLRTIRDGGVWDDPRNFQDVPLLEGMSVLYKGLKSEQELRRVAEQRLADQEAEIGRLVQVNSDQKAELEKLAEEIREQLVSVEGERSDFRAEQQEKMKSLEEEFEKRRQQTDADLTRERQMRAAAEQQVADISQRLSVLQAKYSDLMIGPGELGPARVPDGRVLTAVPGDSVVYIDLGSEDHLVLGLQFAVYSADEGIPESGRAKGRIEVVSIGSSSAECKIQQIVGNAVILEGDLIANPVYDRDRRPTFLVVGSFDLNRDGYPDSDGQKTIESIIENWGGIVKGQLTAMTDFVVVGDSPPRPPRIESPDAEEATRLSSMQQDWDQYGETVVAANNLSIPVMTQEVFLNFLGNFARH